MRNNSSKSAGIVSWIVVGRCQFLCVGRLVRTHTKYLNGDGSNHAVTSRDPTAGEQGDEMLAGSNNVKYE